jgi:pyrimidine deaminase RibD-like protein
MAVALDLARRCPPSRSAYSVGAVLVGADGRELASGYSRDTDELVHAEESALAKLAGGKAPGPGASLYSTLEPCSRRASRPRPCARLIIDAGIRRVVLAWREPTLFVAEPSGVEVLAAAGVEVVELPELAAAARAVNTHLVG